MLLTFARVMIGAAGCQPAFAAGQISNLPHNQGPIRRAKLNKGQERGTL
jgi:hypothetical protein